MNTKKTKSTPEYETRPGAERQQKFAKIVTWTIIGALVLSIAIPAIVGIFL